jgi:glycosyltransferase involved in cell wall biosynthesis
MKNKVLVITNVYPYKDEKVKAGLYASDQIESLEKEGFEFSIAKSNAIKPKIIKYPTLIINTIKRMFGKFEIIHCFNIFPSGTFGVIVKKVRRKPLIMTSLGSDINVMPNHSKKMRWVIKKTLMNADKIIAVSNALKSKIVKLGVSEEKVEVIACGVDTNLFKVRNKEKIRKDLGIKEKFIVIYVGPFVGNKNPDHIMKAFKKADVANSKLIMVGAGEEFEKFKKIGEDLKIKNMLFTGWINKEKVAEYMSTADVFILASTNEGSPTVIKEAIASGIPVIASKTGGNTEMIEEGVNGFLFNVGDINMLSKRIKEFSSNSDKIKTIKKNVLEETKKYEITNDNQKLKKIYLDLIEKYN